MPSSILCCELIVILILLQHINWLTFKLYTAALVFIVQQLAISKLIAQRHYLTTVHDTANAWSGIGAAIYALLQQKKLPSSIWAMIGVAIYLACVSVMHIASSTIMQFIAFNSTSTISVQTLIAWPNSSVLSIPSWTYAIETMPPISLIDDLKTNGLLNNTIYDIIATTQSSFTNATVNATSLQASCGLLSNLSYYNSSISPGLNFSVDGLGQGTLVSHWHLPKVLSNTVVGSMYF